MTHLKGSKIMSLTKVDYSFFNRIYKAMYNTCKYCERSNCKTNSINLMPYYLGNEKIDNHICDLSDNTKYKLIMKLRNSCPYNVYESNYPKERDTTYPGHTHSPLDNSDLNLQKDSSDIDFDPNLPERCDGFLSNYVKPNNNVNYWDIFLDKFFYMKREERWPNLNEAFNILIKTKIPDRGFLIGYAPLIMNIKTTYKGLWFYKSKVIDFTCDKNKEKVAEMKKLIMNYLYKRWFLEIPEEKREGVFLILQTSPNYSIAKDLSWWIQKAFKDEKSFIEWNDLKGFYDPRINEDEIEFISLNVLEKAQLAAELSDSGCSTHTELDQEAIAYDELLNRLGYKIDYDYMLDKDDKPIY